MTRPSPLPLPFSPIVPRGPRLPDPAPYIDAAVVLLKATLGFESVDEIIQRDHRGDVRIAYLTRAPVQTADTSTVTAFSQTSALDVISVLGPQSGGAAALASPGSISFTFDDNLGVYIADIVADAGNAGFVQENTPIPARQLTIDNSTLKPSKFAIIVPFSREVVAHSRPNIGALVRTAIADCISLQFDSALFDDGAASSSRPAGLRQGIDAASKVSTATSPYDAMLEDLQTLISSVSTIAGNGSIIVVASPSKAAAIKLRAPKPLAYQVIASSGLASGLCCAIASNALVSAFGAPRFDASTQATIHLDTAPSEISALGTPNVVAAVVASAFQTDSIFLKIVLECSWALRNAAGLAWLSTTAW